MEPGAFKVLVPAKSAAYLVPDIVITPMLAFDAMGNRLGYGGGFYDRTLAKLRDEGDCRAIGFAYAAQKVAEVVIDRFDQRLDSIITEEDVRIVK
jgi:5-formyltetrahydrofolate cyclo-ligase